MEIGKVIKERRSILKITQSDLSDLSGVSLRMIKSIEIGDANPSLKILSKIADILGMEVTLSIKK